MTSPSPSKTLLDFYAALKETAEGRKITRLEWDNDKIVVSFSSDHLRIALPGNNYIPCDLILTLADVAATDWYVMS